MSDFNAMVIADRKVVTANREFAGIVAANTSPENGPRAVAGEVAEKRAANKPTGKTKPAASSSKQGRWLTFNEFVDLIGPHLSLAEREVYIRMFRYAIKGVVETTVRRMAASGRINKATVSKALKTLESVGLIRTIWKSDTHGKSSRYSIHPHPNECLANVQKRISK